MWINGPFFCSTADITIFRGGKSDESKDNWDKSALYFQLPEGKKVTGDGGYIGEPTKCVTKSKQYPKEMQAWIARSLARQETNHTRLKFFNILGNVFCHGKNTEEKMRMHKMAVEAVATLVQYDYEHGHPPFDVNTTSVI